MVMFLSKYWKILLALAVALFVINWYGNKKFTEGYTFAKAKYEEEYRQKLELEKKDYLAKKKAFDDAVIDAQKKTADANAAKADAEKKAAEERRKSNFYYSQWQEALQNGQIPVSDPSGPHHFTYGFVGMYNLALRMPEACGPEGSGSSGSLSTTGCSDKREINVPEVAEAAGLERGALPTALTQTSSITEEGLLYNAQYNYQIANACLVERKLINEYFNKLCDLGFCE